MEDEAGCSAAKVSRNPLCKGPCCLRWAPFTSEQGKIQLWSNQFLLIAAKGSIPSAAGLLSPYAAAERSSGCEKHYGLPLGSCDVPVLLIGGLLLVLVTG